MIALLLGILIGLVIGWNFFDQPVAVRLFVYKWQVKLGLKKDNDYNPDN